MQKFRYISEFKVTLTPFHEGNEKSLTYKYFVSESTVMNVSVGCGSEFIKYQNNGRQARKFVINDATMTLRDISAFILFE